MVSDLLLGLIAGSGLTWVFMELRRNGFWRGGYARHHGSSPPPPGRKPSPPARPPEQPLTAQLIRHWRCTLIRWRGPGPTRVDVPIRFGEGETQRGNGNGGPTTPKPPIKPQPHGGRQLRSHD